MLAVLAVRPCAGAGGAGGSTAGRLNDVIVGDDMGDDSGESDSADIGESGDGGGMSSSAGDSGTSTSTAISSPSGSRSQSESTHSSWNNCCSVALSGASFSS